MACDRFRYGIADTWEEEEEVVVVVGREREEEDASSSDALLIPACKEGQEAVPRLKLSFGIDGMCMLLWLAVVVIILSSGEFALSFPSADSADSAAPCAAEPSSPWPHAHSVCDMMW